MKKMIFTLAVLLIGSFTVCYASHDGSPAADAARQFGFYIGHGDEVKAGLMSISSQPLYNYVKSVKAELDFLGGFTDVSIVKEEVITENQEVRITIAFHCLQNDTHVEKTFFMRLIDNQWKVDLTQK